MTTLNTYRDAEKTYAVFQAEFDNALENCTKRNPDAFNSEKLREWVVNAVHEVYDLGIYDALDAVDDAVVTGYAIKAGISAGLGYERIADLVEAMKEVLSAVEPEDARRQAEEWDKDYYGTDSSDDADDDDYD